MIENPQAVFSEFGTMQLIAFVSFAIATVGFFVWVVKLWFEKHH